MSFGIYVHYPYCARVCPYCDFNVVARHSIPHQRYADAILTELDSRALEFTDRGDVVSIYFGGGTPGLWPADQIGRVLDGIRVHFSLASDAEITIELNPEDATEDGFRDLSEIGVNRMSLGAQSFQPALLQKLGRQHTQDDIVNAIRWARLASINNISVDLLYGHIGHGLESSLEDVKRAVGLGAKHISTYQLTIEDKTLFGREFEMGINRLEPESHLLDMFRSIRRFLVDAGYSTYEISSAARPGYRSQHNLVYWTGRDYLALGAGAHGFYRTDSGEGIRWGNICSPERYMDAVEAGRPTEQFKQTSTGQDLQEELLMMGLRMEEGLLVTEPMKAYFADNADRCARLGLIVIEGGRWRVSARGQEILDAVTLEMIS
ncbi:MAG: radical SAM family heme chaperone HemW [Myxococcota bacterium]|nr:radical SAM family heme chaperone HemW [Myxococcota bacterium]